RAREHVGKEEQLHCRKRTRVRRVYRRYSRRKREEIRSPLDAVRNPRDMLRRKRSTHTANIGRKRRGNSRTDPLTVFWLAKSRLYSPSPNPKSTRRGVSRAVTSCRSRKRSTVPGE